MIDLVKAQSPYVHDYGDIIYGEYGGWIREFRPSDITDAHNVLRLGYFGQNTWNVIKTALWFNNEQIAELEKLCTYECPFTDRTYQALMPSAIISPDVEKYFGHAEHKPWFFEMACDRSWNYDDRNAEAMETGALTHLQTVMMGPGYTHGCYPNDGDWSYNPVLVDLANGDMLYCVTLVWHNK